MRFAFSDTPLPGLWLIERFPVADERGFLCRTYCHEEFAAAGIERPPAQINHTMTRRRGAVRGLHFQHPPHAETKLVSCLAGSIFDVAVDIRRGSPTFLRWHSAVLSAENGLSLLIPEGFAHGFQTLDENCSLLYLHTVPYSAAAEGALNVTDPAIAIEWPLPIAELSVRDRAHPFVDPRWEGIAL